MSWDQLLDVALAVVLVLALGVSAGAMDGAVTTNPDDAIDIDSRLLPVGMDAIGELKQEVLHSEEDPPEAGEEDERPAGESQTGPDQLGKAAGDGTEETNSKSGDDGLGTTPEIDWWQWLLRQLLYVGLVLVVLGGVVVASVAVSRHRDRLDEWLALVLARLGLATVEETDVDVTPETPPPECPDEVSRAWYEMVCCLGLEADCSKTPGECAQAAIDAGHDPEVVRLLTDAYQCVRYGGQPVTDELVAQTRAAVERVHERENASLRPDREAEGV